MPTPRHSFQIRRKATYASAHQLTEIQCKRERTVAVTRLGIVHRRKLILRELVLVLLMRPLERLSVSLLQADMGVIRRTATQARIDVEMGAGSETRGASTSASSFGMNLGTVYGNASTLGVSEIPSFRSRIAMMNTHNAEAPSTAPWSWTSLA